MRLAVTAAVIVAACGGSGGGTTATACNITLSGGSTGSFGCTSFQSGFQSSNNFTQVSSGIAGLAGSSISINVAGPLHAGTFTDADGTTKATMSVGNAGKVWTLEVARAGGTDHGTFALHVEQVSTTTVTNVGTGYAIHGNLDATLTPLSGTTDNLALHWDF
ncbi:MAG TPA: hypothetical protein VFL36_11470 [Myxococcales bacterium]|nr:hypothetical protein [Myxococcales bacterium]